MTALDLLRRSYSMLEIESSYLKKEIEEQKDSSTPCGDLSLMGIQYSTLITYSGLILERIKYHEQLEAHKLEEMEVPEVGQVVDEAS